MKIRTGNAILDPKIAPDGSHRGHRGTGEGKNWVLPSGVRQSGLVEPPGDGCRPGHRPGGISPGGVTRPTFEVRGIKAEGSSRKARKERQGKPGRGLFTVSTPPILCGLGVLGERRLSGPSRPARLGRFTAPVRPVSARFARWFSDPGCSESPGPSAVVLPVLPR